MLAVTVTVVVKVAVSVSVSVSVETSVMVAVGVPVTVQSGAVTVISTVEASGVAVTVVVTSVMGTIDEQSEEGPRARSTSSTSFRACNLCSDE